MLRMKESLSQKKSKEKVRKLHKTVQVNIRMPEALLDGIETVCAYKNVQSRDWMRIQLAESVAKAMEKLKSTKPASLRFRLNWSKAKISTILTNLDKKGIVQRQRTGKTYNIYLQKPK